MFCNTCGLDAVHDFSGLGYCISCKSLYFYDENLNQHVEVEVKETNKILAKRNGVLELVNRHMDETLGR